MQYIQLQPQSASTVPIPSVGNLNLFLDQSDNIVKTKNDNGIIFSQVALLTSCTYLELFNNITGGTLTTGSYYMINDFRTCYDQPDFDSNGYAILTGNYKESDIDPIIVFATSQGTIDTNAYQPSHPNDKIKYDWSFSATEVTNGIAYGRITERIDEFNNRTDYDHRTILFKRYMYIELSFNNPLQGKVTVNITSPTEMSVTGIGTNFTSLGNGDYVGFQNTDFRAYQVVSISGDTEMYITGLTSTGVNNVEMYLGYGQTDTIYYQNNITTAYTEYYTFDYNNTNLNNYIGNFANMFGYDENSFILANNVFQGSTYRNNTFGNSCYNNSFNDDCENNIIGNYFYNNSTDDDFDGNIIGNWFRNNRITSNFQYNRIGENFQYNYLVQGSFNRNNIMNYFDNNVISGGDFQNNKIGNQFNNNITRNGQFYKNNIGNGFNYNKIYFEFYGNLIGNGFNNNNLYCEFYNNTISENFYSNFICNYVDNNNYFNFNSNKIGNGFGQNTIRQNFQDNQIGNEFQSNIINGNFYKNVIGNEFSNNQNIGYNFYGNHIGNNFSSNQTIGDYFENNQIGNNFVDNQHISYNFKNNQIGYQFENNTLGNTTYFNWDNTTIINLTGRTYNTLYNSLNEEIDNVILGKELMMHFYHDSGTTITNSDLIIGEIYEITNYTAGGDFSNVANVISGVINTNGCIFIATGTTPTLFCGTTLTELTVYNEYHKVKFTQWTKDNNGGGFSYERTKVYPSNEPTVYFTKINYENMTDVIVSGRLEITRGNDGGIYNMSVEGGWNNNVSPTDTQWNSIYTQNNNGSSFVYNKIAGEFKGNYILNNFGNNTVNSQVASNQFSGVTFLNNFGLFTLDNDFLGDVILNTWGGNFYSNNIGGNFDNNTFSANIWGNKIGENFQNNQVGLNFYRNIIGDNFGFGGSTPKGNIIGNDFYWNQVGEYFYNNSISDSFTFNTIGEHFQWNIINTIINSVDFTVNYGKITGFTYTSNITDGVDNIYNELTGTTNNKGINATFNVEISGGTVIGITGNSQGNFYGINDVITILSSQVGGTNNEQIDITVTGVSETPSVYEEYTCQIFERQGGNKRLSYYDDLDILNITDINL